MSEDGFSDSFEEPNMEIQIETLMASSFEMRVSSTDTIREIKQRIQRVEGIPVSHQNLIFQSKELRDTNRLCDAGIKDGSKIKLVLSMRGGPISTRRISAACEHHMMLKELKELLENTRDEIGDKLAPGSKVSVLVFKEGDIINLLRVIENEDGSYSPYNEKPISPPTKSNRISCRMALFEKLVEDNKMMTNISSLRRKMEDAQARKQAKTSKNELEKCNNTECLVKLCATDPASELPYKLLGDYEGDLLDNVDLKIFERHHEEGGRDSETEEIALKDKHRTKVNRSPKAKIFTNKSLYSESKGAFSHTKQTYARMHKKSKDLKASEASSSSRERRSSEELLNSSLLSPLCLQSNDKVSEVDRAVTPTLVEEMAVAGASRVHVTRLVISDNAERPKSTPGPDSIELEENARQDLWEIHEPTAQRLKHSATCKVGVMKRRQSLDYGYDGLDNAPPNVPQDLGEFNYCKNSDFEVCSGNFYHVPQFMSSPSAIPPQYAPKDQGVCNYYFRNSPRSPLYGRKTINDGLNANLNYSRNGEEFNKALPKLPEIKSSATNTDKFNYLGDCSSIQRLKNDCAETTTGGDRFFTEHDETIDELYGYYNIGCATDFLSEKKLIESTTTVLDRKDIDLPPVMKKKARCSYCNKRLNITNIYSCRCGKIFCSQHRYSEVHQCNYDYKTDGRRFLEQQNPLVTAEKINRI